MVLMSSLIPSLVILIEVSAVEIVFLRTLIAMVILGIYLPIKGIRIKVEVREFLGLILTGILTAFYWVLLIISAKLSNASVCLVGLATAPLWISLIAPFFGQKKLDLFEILIAVNAVFGVYVIFDSNFAYVGGLTVSIISAVFAAIVTLLNGKISRHHHHLTATFYQMGGAWLGTLILYPLLTIYAPDASYFFMPSTRDILLIVLLAFIFSIVIWSVFIKVMRTIPPFVVALSNNLLPIYGIIAALLIRGEQEQMTLYFYAGAVIIISSVFVNPLAKMVFQKRALPKS